MREIHKSRLISLVLQVARIGTVTAVRVAGIRSAGGAVETIDVPDPRPLAADEVLIEVRAAGVANWDDIVRQGGWDVGAVPPMALGVAAAGVIADAGRAGGDLVAGGFAPGTEVLTHPLPLRGGQGTWAPWLIAPAALLARKPAGMTWEAAGALPVPALTATQVLDEALALREGETLLVNGAGGVTGRLLVALGAIRGARVIATAGPASHELLRSLGADHVLDYHDSGWVREARGIAGAGVDAAANAARDRATTAIGAIRDGGRLATITGDPPDAQRSIQISSVYVRPDGPQLQAAADLHGEGRLSIEVGAAHPVADAALALEAAIRGSGGAAIVLGL
jgi:NADPH:quinone reductase-like Zn-dependent oxidoreductase